MAFGSAVGRYNPRFCPCAPPCPIGSSSTARPARRDLNSRPGWHATPRSSCSPSRTICARTFPVAGNCRTMPMSWCSACPTPRHGEAVDLAPEARFPRCQHGASDKPRLGLRIAGAGVRPAGSHRGGRPRGEPGLLPDGLRAEREAIDRRRTRQSRSAAARERRVRVFRGRQVQ